jgi:hypothetical protein
MNNLHMLSAPSYSLKTAVLDYKTPSQTLERSLRLNT